MTEVTPFKIAMVFTADTAGAKAGVADVTGGVRAVGTEVAKTSAAARKGAANLDTLAAAAAKAAMTHDDLAAARKRAAMPAVAMPQNFGIGDKVVASFASQAATAAPLVAAFKTTAATAGALQASVAGLNNTIGSQAQDMLEAARSAATYQAALDDIRASYNPLFAASRQYEQQLDRIAEAERIGAINAREAAAARAAAAAQLGPAGPMGSAGPGGTNSMYTANVAAQGFDIGVTAAMGMSPMMIGLQQGTHLVQVMQQMGGGKQALAGIASGFLAILNPMSLATIGIVAFGALGIQALMKLLPETKTFKEAMGDLADSIDSYERNISRSRSSTTDLAREFGAAADGVRILLREMAELDRQTAERKAKTVISTIKEQQGLWMPELGWANEAPDSTNFQLFDAQRANDIGDMRKVFGLDRSDASRTLVSSVLDAMTRMNAATGLDAQIAALSEVEQAWQAAAEKSEGVSKDEAERLREFKEARLELERLRGLDGNAAGVEQAKATTRELYQQVELQRATLAYGQDSAEVRQIQNRHERENLNLKLESLGIDQQSLEGRRAINTLIDLQAQREKAAAEARREWFAAQDDQLAAVQREIALIGMSAAEQARINALAEAELDIRDRKLTALEAEKARTKAIAQAEAEIVLARKRAMQDLAAQAQMDGYDARAAEARNPYIRADIEAERAYAQEMAASGDATVADQAATQARARAIREADRAQTDYLRSQAEGIQALQLEIALIGQSAEVRARVLALVRAEQEIIRLGASGEAADAIRETARAQAEMGQQLEAQVDAWRRVQWAGESAIDGVLDALRGGDVKDAFGALIGEIEQGFFDLAIRNPLKNMLLGTNLGTWEDVGGWTGIWNRMSGKQPLDEAAAIQAATMPVQSMAVNAASVVLSGNLSGLTGAMGAANLNIAPVRPYGGSLPGSADVQAQVWAFFAAKGLAPHQIAGIMGNASAESGFNPLAVGDGGNAHGLFQWNDRKSALFDFIGGQQNLGDIQKQLEFAWHELMTSEAGPMRRLMASTDVRGATEAFLGFERPSGYQYGVQQSSHYDKRIAAAEAAMGKFETATVNAQQQLGQLGAGAAQLGTGMQAFGANVAGIIQQAGAQRGLGGMVVGGLLTGLGQMIGIPGFAAGSWTGPGADTDVAGVVHANEFVFDAAATRRIGVANLEAIRKGTMRGYLSGGHVTARGAPPMDRAANSAAAPQGAREPVVFHINVSGTGDAQLQAGVQQAIAQALETYDRQALPDRVRMVVNDRWGS